MKFTGVVHETGGGVYTVVLDDDRRVDASIRGRLKQEQRTGSRVVIGDRVDVLLDGERVAGKQAKGWLARLVRSGEFPEEDTVIEALRSRLGG